MLTIDLIARSLKANQCVLKIILNVSRWILNMPKMKNVIISCVYRTPCARLDTFCESLETIISGMNVNKALYICGDFNIDLLKNNIHTSTKNVLDMMYSLGM